MRTALWLRVNKFTEIFQASCWPDKNIKSGACNAHCLFVPLCTILCIFILPMWCGAGVWPKRKWAIVLSAAWWPSHGRHSYQTRGSLDQSVSWSYMQLALSSFDWRYLRLCPNHWAADAVACLRWLLDWISVTWSRSKSCLTSTKRLLPLSDSSWWHSGIFVHEFCKSIK